MANSRKSIGGLASRVLQDSIEYRVAKLLILPHFLGMIGGILAGLFVGDWFGGVFVYLFVAIGLQWLMLVRWLLDEVLDVKW